MMTAALGNCAATPAEQYDGEKGSKARWIISSSALFLLEQVYRIDRFPSLEMRQRLADDLGVSARQVRARAPRGP